MNRGIRHLSVIVIIFLLQWGFSHTQKTVAQSGDTSNESQQRAALLDANGNQLLDDAEIRHAIQIWISGAEIGSSGLRIDDAQIRELIKMWISGERIIGANKAPSDDVPGGTWKPGDYWIFDATSTDGLDVTTRQFVLGTMTLGNIQVYVSAALTSDNQSQALESASILFTSVDTLTPVDLFGNPLDFGLDTIEIEDKGVVSVSTRAGTFQATQFESSSDELSVTSWSTDQIGRAIKTIIKQDKEQMTEEIVSIESKNPNTLMDSLLDSLQVMLQDEGPQIKVNAIRALASLGQFDRNDEIIDMLNALQTDTDPFVQDEINEAILLLEEGIGVFLEKSESTEVDDPATQNEFLPQQAAVAVTAIALLSDAFTITGGLKDKLGSTVVSMPQPCSTSDAVTINLDVGDIVSQWPLHVDFSLGPGRRWGIDGLRYLGPQLFYSLINNTYQYDIKIVNSKNESVVPKGWPKTGRSGLDMPPQNLIEMFSASKWTANGKKATSEAFKIIATLSLVDRLDLGVVVGGVRAFVAGTGIVLKKECDIIFQVHNPFYYVKDSFKLSGVHDHHKDIFDHALSFQVMKRSNIKNFTSPPPQGWIISPLDIQDATWEARYSLKCAVDNEFSKPSDCKAHTASQAGNVTVGKSGSKSITSTTQSVNESYSLIKMTSNGGTSDLHHIVGDQITQGSHQASRDMIHKLNLLISVNGKNALGSWSTDSVLDGSNITALPISLSGLINDLDRCSRNSDKPRSADAHQHQSEQAEECVVDLVNEPPLINDIDAPDMIYGDAENHIVTVEFEDPDGDLEQVRFSTLQGPDAGSPPQTFALTNVDGNTQGEFSFFIFCSNTGSQPFNVTGQIVLIDQQGLESDPKTYSYECRPPKGDGGGSTDPPTDPPGPPNPPPPPANAPVITNVAMPSIIPIGNSSMGTIFFMDPDGDVKQVNVSSTESNPTTFNPQVGGQTSGQIDFLIGCGPNTQPRVATVTITIEDEAGNSSLPKQINYTCG